MVKTYVNTPDGPYLIKLFHLDFHSWNDHPSIVLCERVSLLYKGLVKIWTQVITLLVGKVALNHGMVTPEAVFVSRVEGGGGKLFNP